MRGASSRCATCRSASLSTSGVGTDTAYRRTCHDDPPGRRHQTASPQSPAPVRWSAAQPHANRPPARPPGNRVIARAPLTQRSRAMLLVQRSTSATGSLCAGRKEPSMLPQRDRQTTTRSPETAIGRRETPTAKNSFNPLFPETDLRQNSTNSFYQKELTKIRPANTLVRQRGQRASSRSFRAYSAAPAAQTQVKPPQPGSPLRTSKQSTAVHPADDQLPSRPATGLSERPRLDIIAGHEYAGLQRS